MLVYGDREVILCEEGLLFRTRSYVQERSAQNVVQDTSLNGESWSFGRPADLEPPERLGFQLGVGLGLGLRLWSGWSRRACKVETGATHPAQSIGPTNPAHGRSVVLKCTCMFPWRGYGFLYGTVVAPVNSTIPGL